MENLINKHLVQQRFGRSLSTYRLQSGIQSMMAEKLLKKLPVIDHNSFQNVLEIGCGCGLFTEKLLRKVPVKHLTVNDLVPETFDDIKEIIKNHPALNFEFLPGDIEQTEIRHDYYDLIISNAVFQWLENLPDFFKKCTDSLTSDGLMAFTTFGPENLAEIRELTGVGLNYKTLNDLLAILAKEYEIITQKEDIIKLNFDSPRHVLKHMRATGVTGVSQQSWTKSDLSDFYKKYSENFTNENGSVHLTYHPIYIVARKK